MTAAGEVLDWITRSADPAERAKLARWGIPQDRAAGIPMHMLLAKVRALGPDMTLARALWASGGDEARTLAAMVADPGALTPAEMDDRAQGFDSWAICDTVAFRLFDRSPHAWDRIGAWAADSLPLVRRAGHATLWALALLDRSGGPARYVRALGRIAAGPDEAEPIVAEAIDMALRAVARRPGLKPVIADLARRLAADADRPRLARHFARAAR